jgi:AcrR family transcriptional regulator
MSIADRRHRERAQRHDLIVAAARDLAESEGWDAVTTRRLAQLVEYSQPVLYSHFDGKEAIVRAVAIEGFADLAAKLRQARLDVGESGPALRAVCGAYLTFAAERPAVYEAMFVLPIDLQFASEETPPALRAAFNELVSAVSPFDANPDLRAEVTWAALHGLAILRLDLLVSQVVEHNVKRQ